MIRSTLAALAALGALAAPCRGAREAPARSHDAGPGAARAPVLPDTASGLPPAPFAEPTMPAPTWSPTVLAPDDLAANAAFGSAIALDGDLLVVGAPGQLMAEGVKGTAHVYERAAGAWQRTAVLAGEPGARRFGHAVAVRDGVIAIAAAHGGVAIYGKQGKRWQRSAAIELPLIEERPIFSVELALDGDTLAVGVDDWLLPGARGAGAVLVYRRAADGWQLRETLTAPDAQARARADEQPNFGSALALRGGRLAVAARQADCPGPVDMCGAVYLFEPGDAGWTAVEALPRRVLARWAMLGVSVAGDGDRVALAVSGEKRAWILERTTDGWRDAGTLADLGIAAGDDSISVGGAVAIRGRLAALATQPKQPTGPPPVLPGTNEIDTEALRRQRGTGAGAVHLYVRQPTGWQHVAALASPNAAPGDTFGDALALGDGVLAIGSARARDERGEVVVFQ